MLDFPNALGHDPALTAYVAALREALTLLVEAVQIQAEAPVALRATGIFDCRWAIDNARQVLRMETGRLAQEEFRLAEDLASEGYTLADYCHHQLYGTPRAPYGHVPTLTEVKDALVRIETLTRHSWALEELR